MNGSQHEIALLQFRELANEQGVDEHAIARYFTYEGKTLLLSTRKTAAKACPARATVEENG